MLLRLCAGIPLIYFAAGGLSGKPPLSIPFAQNAIAIAGGILLVAGLWTPVAAALTAIDEVWIALSLRSPTRELLWIHIILAVMWVSVAMLGPGAWSVDARLFGRRRFDIGPTRGR